MTPQEIEQHNEAIDSMTRQAMASLWRFAPSGHPYFNSKLPLYARFKARFEKLGGFSPTISKAIGWKK